jgi:DNA-directed RNA polymerase subunit alpha
MLKKQINPIVISCRDSLKENSQSFYGRFYIGPFDSGQGLTIANALRRTLLSELTGLGITSVTIDGVTHEYSTIPGVQETVFDILLNLKRVVFKSTTTLKKPQIGYLQINGPKTIRAMDLQLPPHIQCVNPEQHIATISIDGVLKMKFKIRQGQNYLLNNSEFQDLRTASTQSTNTLINKVHQTLPFKSKKQSKELLLDPVFIPVNKVNYVLEMDERVSNSKSILKKEELIILEIWTNGSISPYLALQKAIKKLINIFINIKNAPILK